MAIKFVQNINKESFSVYDDRFPNIRTSVSVDTAAKQYRFQSRMFNDPDGAIRAAVSFIKRSVDRQTGTGALSNALADAVREISTEEGLITWQ